MRTGALIVAMLAASAFAADEPKALKPVHPAAKGVAVVVPKGSGEKSPPVEIKSADDLAKNAFLKDAADEIKKQVDFSKEELVFFSWGGSGGDKIAPDAKAAGTFTLTRGLTRDYRMHVHLFVVPKDAAVKVVTAK